MTSITLHELCAQIESRLKQSMPDSYWVMAEISDFSVNSKGHCYLELIEKPSENQSITAKVRATIWSYSYRLMQAYFKSTTGMDLQAGIKILVKVNVEYHAIYGFSLNITDIDPVYTIGEDEKQRREIIERLQNEGVFDMNQSLECIPVIQRLAIISSPQAAGYQDFMQSLQNNKYGFSFHVSLFTASMQGVEVESSIIQALEQIYENDAEFDVVVIIRGGGSKTDLKWFDNYAIASHIAQFPLPVLTGIGHDKDVSISDLVAYMSFKTPTAVAEYIIGESLEFLQKLETAKQDICNYANSMLQAKQLELQQAVRVLQTNGIQVIHKEQEKHTLYKQQLKNIAISAIQKEKFANTQLNQRLQSSVNNQLQSQKNSLALVFEKIQIYNPTHILKQGYTITSNKDGRIIRKGSQVTKDEVLQTTFADATISSVVI